MRIHVDVIKAYTFRKAVLFKNGRGCCAFSRSGRIGRVPYWREENPRGRHARLAPHSRCIIHKSFTNPLILSLNVELELKAEKDNAEVRVDAVADYQAIVDAEWEIIYRKLQEIEKTGAKVVLSKLPIGDLATQWFADRDIFCAGRVPAGDLRRVVQAVGGSIQSTTSDIGREHLGTCGKFEERQIGGERYNVFEECPKAKTCTIVLRGGAEQFIEEVERSLHDAVMVVKRAVENGEVVAGGGAIEVRAFLTHTRDIANDLCSDGPFCLYAETCAFYSGKTSTRPDRIRKGT